MAPVAADPYGYLGAQRSRILGSVDPTMAGGAYTPNPAQYPADIQAQQQAAEDANMAKWAGISVDQYLAQNAQRRAARTAAGYLNMGDPVRDPSVLQAQADRYGQSTTSPTSEGAYQPGGAFYQQPGGAGPAGPGGGPAAPGPGTTPGTTPGTGTPATPTFTAPTQQEIYDALYGRSSQAINTAADRQRQQLLEGTFGTGVGNSTMQTELQGRLAQEQNDALSRAAMDALTGAGAETRAGQMLALQQQALAQQGSQFNQSLGFQGSQADLNRQAAMALLMQTQSGTSSLAAQQAAAQQAAQLLAQQFTGAQNTQQQQAAMAQLLASITGQAGLQGNAGQIQQALQAAQQQFVGAQNTQQQQAAMAQLMASITGQQQGQQSQYSFLNQQQATAQANALAMLMQNFQNQQTLQGNAALYGGLNQLVSGGLPGIAELLAPYLNRLGGG
jgi:hypothetical protein